MDRQAIFDYVKKKYGTEPEYLWMRYPSYAVLRHQDNQKWYGIVMDVPRSKLGLTGAEIVDILDVKCEPLMTDLLRQSPGFLPGYHMNKSNWLSILLDGTVPDDTILDLLDASFQNTIKSRERVNDMPMKYDLLPEFQKYSWIRLPTQPWLLRAANALMPVIQHGKRLDSSLQSEKVQIGDCTADLIQPNGGKTDNLLIYYHGGAFLIKAAAYHKNLAQTYARKANCAVLFVDYRLAPKYKFPTPVMDCFAAYSWALEQFPFKKLIVGGDSAGADLAMSVMLLAREKGLRMPDGQMLIYPGAASRPDTESMQEFTDTPMWNSVLNAKALALYADEKDRCDPLFMPLLSENFVGFPTAYVETTEFDCLHDAGIEIAQRYRKDGIDVTLNETQHTMHGYDIAEKSSYVQKQVNKRIRYLTQLFAT